MLTLYYKLGCSGCQRVTEALEALNIKPTMKDISTDGLAAAALFDRSGKNQVPYLVDDSQGIEMSEVSDIINHLHKHYADSPVSKAVCSIELT